MEQLKYIQKYILEILEEEIQEKKRKIHILQDIIYQREQEIGENKKYVLQYITI